MKKGNEKLRVEIDYSPDEISVYPRDIADSLDPDASDSEIKKMIRETIDTIVSEGVWPSYTFRGEEDLIKAVREALKDRED